jgi:hypothetical protein
VSREGRIDVRFDRSAPTGTASLSPPANAAGWHRSPVTVTLGGTDAHSDIARVDYAATGGSPVAVHGSSTSTTISREGITTIAYTVTDAAGNVSAPRSVTVRIDATAPTISCDPDPQYLWPADGALDPVRVAVAVRDGGSGPAGFTLVSVTSNSWLLLNVLGFRTGTADTSGWLRAIGTLSSQTARTYTLTYQGRDVAGNTTSCAALVTVAKPPRQR